MAVNGDEPLIQLDNSSESQLQTASTAVAVKSSTSDTAFNNAAASQDILCAFICQFHVKRGNLVEWSYPREFNLENSGIEFKCIPSGAHLIQNDCIYFKYKEYYGISLFRNVSLAPSMNGAAAEGDAVDERGSRMKAVGFICRGTENFVHYRKFLFKEAVKQCQTADSTNQPSQYDHLKSATVSQKSLIQDCVSGVLNANSG